MAYVHGEPFPTNPGGEPIQVSPTETQTTADGLGLPPSPWRRHRTLLALTATVVFAGGGTAAFALKGGGGGGEGSANDGKGGTAGGLAPAVSPSTRTRPTGVVGTRSAAPRPTPSAPKSKATGGAPAISPSTHNAPASSTYDNSATFDCTDIQVARDGDVLHTTPKLTVKGHPDPSKFVTIADYVHGVNPAINDNSHKVFSSVGLGSAVDIQVPPELSWKEDAATVIVAYYPDGNVPTDPDKLSIQYDDPSRRTAACGNAVMTWALTTDQLGGLGGGG